MYLFIFFQIFFCFSRCSLLVIVALVITITIHHTPKTILRNYLVRTKELWSHTTKLRCGDSNYALIVIDCTFHTAHYTLHTSLLNTALSTLHTSQGKPSALWPQKKGSPSKLFFDAIHYLFLCSTGQCDVQCAVYIIQCSIGSLYSAVLGVQCEVLCNGVDSQFCSA